MRIAILANEKDSFVRPLAEGLARMTRKCGASPEVIYDGLEVISLPLRRRSFRPRALARHALRGRGFRKRFDALVERIRDADAVIVVAHVPGSMSRNALQNIEELRRRLPHIPMVNYDLIYLPTVEKWGAAMLQGDLSDISTEEARLITPAPFGMERYDWYLAASVASEIAMPAGDHPCSLIGMDIDDGQLYPDQQGEFRVLMDFSQSRKNYPSFRTIQLEALGKAGVPFRVLHGTYTRSEIRALYRTTGAFMLAHRESFGLPICELQACGSLIFTPRAEWAGAHWLKEDASVAGPGTHSPNIIVYDNRVEALVDRLLEAKAAFDPVRVVQTFDEVHPQLHYGDLDALARFLGRVDSGAIHGGLHWQHATVGRRVAV